MRLDVSRSGRLSTQPRIISTPQSFEKGIDIIKDTLEKIGTGHKLDGIVIGIAGSLNEDKSALDGSPHLPNWIKKPLKERLSTLFDAPVILENDTALVGLGEATAGAGRNHDIVAYLTVSTGFGGVRIVNKNIDHNRLGFEPGHQIISYRGEPFEEVPQVTTLEKIISGSAILKRFGKSGELVKDPKVWEEANRWTAFGVINTILYWSPDIVVIGGSVSENLSAEKIQNHIRDNLSIFSRIPKVVKAELGNSGGLYGGLYLIESKSLAN